MKMKKSARLLSLLVPLLWLLVRAPAEAGTGPSAASSSKAETTTETLAGEVRGIDFENGTLDLLTGCGHALRIVRIAVTSETRITQMGGTARFSDLKRGACIRVQCLRAKDSNSARTIEAVTP